MTRRKSPASTQPPAPSDQPPPSPITDLEMALVNLLVSANDHSRNTRRTPEVDAAAEAYRIHHGPIPALIADPVQHALAAAVHVLRDHARSTMSEADFTAMMARVERHAAQTPRYAPDNRVKH